MKKHTVTKFLLICWVIMAFTAVSAAEARAERWPLSIQWPPSNFSTQGVMEFADLVKERTDGQVAIEVHAGGALGYRGPDTLQAVKDGLVPAAEMLLGGVAGTEPIMDFSTMPFLADDPGEAHLLGLIARPYVENVFEKWNQKLLYWQYWPGAGLYTNKKINSLEDLEGLTLRAFNRVSAQWVEKAGAKPNTMPWGDVYMALSTGAIDGVLTSAVSGKDGKFWEIMSHFTNIGFTFGYSAVTVNLDSWNKLSPEVRLAILETAREMEAKQELRSIRAHTTSMEALEENGVVISEDPIQLKEECVKLARPIWDEWVKEVGPEGKEIIETFHNLTGK